MICIGMNINSRLTPPNYDNDEIIICPSPEITYSPMSPKTLSRLEKIKNFADYVSSDTDSDATVRISTSPVIPCSVISESSCSSGAKGVVLWEVLPDLDSVKMEPMTTFIKQNSRPPKGTSKFRHRKLSISSDKCDGTDFNISQPSKNTFNATSRARQFSINSNKSDSTIPEIDTVETNKSHSTSIFELKSNDSDSDLFPELIVKKYKKKLKKKAKLSPAKASVPRKKKQNVPLDISDDSSNAFEPNPKPGRKKQTAPLEISDDSSDNFQPPPIRSARVIKQKIKQPVFKSTPKNVICISSDDDDIFPELKIRGTSSSSNSGKSFITCQSSVSSPAKSDLGNCQISQNVFSSPEKSELIDQDSQSSPADLDFTDRMSQSLASSPAKSELTNWQSIEINPVKSEWTNCKRIEISPVKLELNEQISQSDFSSPEKSELMDQDTRSIPDHLDFTGHFSQSLAISPAKSELMGLDCHSIITLSKTYLTDKASQSVISTSGRSHFFQQMYQSSVKCSERSDCEERINQTPVKFPVKSHFEEHIYHSPVKSPEQLYQSPVKHPVESVSNEEIYHSPLKCPEKSNSEEQINHSPLRCPEMSDSEEQINQSPLRCPEKSSSEKQLYQSPLRGPEKSSSEKQLYQSPLRGPEKSSSEEQLYQSPLRCPEKSSSEEQLYQSPEKSSSDEQLYQSPLRWPEKSSSEKHIYQSPLKRPEKSDSDEQLYQTPVKCPEMSDSEEQIYHSIVKCSEKSYPENKITHRPATSPDLLEQNSESLVGSSAQSELMDQTVSIEYSPRSQTPERACYPKLKVNDFPSHFSCPTSECESFRADFCKKYLFAMHPGELEQLRLSFLNESVIPEFIPDLLTYLFSFNEMSANEISLLLIDMLKQGKYPTSYGRMLIALVEKSASAILRSNFSKHDLLCLRYVVTAVVTNYEAKSGAGNVQSTLAWEMFKNDAASLKICEFYSQTLLTYSLNVETESNEVLVELLESLQTIISVALIISPMPNNLAVQIAVILELKYLKLLKIDQKCKFFSHLMCSAIVRYNLSQIVLRESLGFTDLKNGEYPIVPSQVVKDYLRVIGIGDVESSLEKLLVIGYLFTDYCDCVQEQLHIPHGKRCLIEVSIPSNELSAFKALESCINKLKEDWEVFHPELLQHVKCQDLLDTLLFLSF